MSIKRYIANFLALTIVGKIALAGCLEPKKDLGSGNFLVESCSYYTTTKIQYDDPRLSDQKIKNPSDVLAINKKSGAGKILSLPKGNYGVLISGKFKNAKTVAFINTEDPKYCDRFAKNSTAVGTLVENCCDCMNSCSEAPCALGTKNEFKVK